MTRSSFHAMRIRAVTMRFLGLNTKYIFLHFQDIRITVERRGEAKA